ncbi:MAG: cyclic nucleotide-binding domain-containing protein, partial [Desulfobacterales bacterium]|nr:cyclic nucleotide-binding domain-containing protein [Desulfobacterales bacterium]
MSEHVLNYLSNMPHFSFLPRDELKNIAGRASIETHEKGAVYATQDKTRVDSIFVMVKGAFALYEEKQGERKLAGYIKPSEVFGGITILLNGGTSLRTVVVERDCRGFAIPSEIFQDLCTR